ncbi:MAG: pyridoxamine 5'-phosphate oxidase family protein [Acidimicrobiales bacterium]
MSELYGPGARALQDHFDARRLADLLSTVTVHDELNDDDIALIGAQSTVWLSTVDADGWPDVSYKGGLPGFVRVVDPRTIELPLYDGNGMFRSAGNITDTGRVALLFIDTDRPWRLRLHGTATVVTDEARLADHHGAKALIEVTVTRAFPNCGRYIHAGDDTDAAGLSDFVPRPGSEPPIPEWKTFDGISQALPADDPARVDPADPSPAAG